MRLGARGIVLAGSLVALGAGTVSAQVRWQVDASVGGGSVPVISTALANVFTSGFSFGTYESGPTRSDGAMGVRIVRVRDRHGFGVSYTHEVIRNQVWLEDADPTPDGDQVITAQSLILESFLIWDAVGTVRASSGIAFGPALLTDRVTIEGDSEEADKLAFAHQVDAITLSIGGRLRGWTSLGFGYRGIGAVGVAYTP
ncbi:MAG: hypothetical protein M3N43_04810 [Actinomycetota bacterium]|nr:hypothetical protein [Actinomycetota bacterium]